MPPCIWQDLNFVYFTTPYSNSAYLDVILDTTTMGQEAVVVKNGMRLCGTGAARGSSPILQDKAYWEVKIQQGGVWSVGIATPSADLNKVGFF